MPAPSIVGTALRVSRVGLSDIEAFFVTACNPSLEHVRSIRVKTLLPCDDAQTRDGALSFACQSS